MKRFRWRGWRIALAAVPLSTATVLGSLGCDRSCRADLTCWPLAVSCPEDPADWGDRDIPAECGIWVSASLGDDKNDGSPDAPVATLGQAVAMASDGPRRVYACAEEFAQPIEVPAGVSLHGGFHCDDLDWRYLGRENRTTVVAPADEIPLVLTGTPHAKLSILTDLRVVAADAGQPGGSSIAVLAQADAIAEIRRSRLESGDGADGADGDDGDHFGHPAKDGLHGNNGVAACAAPVNAGGDLVALDCEDDASFGGQGGDGGEMAASAGDDGEVAPASNPQGFGLGGKGEDLVAGLFCTPGIGGAAGEDGEPALGGFWPPRLTADGYLGVWGGDGRRGRAGQGGGGGGASAGTAMACGAAAPGGASGGSGGTGGCGGKGGRGGQPGGASIGLATLTEALLLRNVEIVAGNGGNGGAGGIPQQGGQGGLPGVGGAGALSGAKPGCGGGIGGYGGDGGHSGGGLGGSSLAVAYVGARLLDFGESQLLKGQAGHGGPGSNPSLGSARGEDGKSSQLEVLLP